jgi:hypothetical protein
MFRKCLIGLALGAFVYPAGAYYVAWEGDCLPEEAGWTRQWGDEVGQYHGTGAVRTIQDGVMTMDSLYDMHVCDGSILHRSFNPAPGEMFFLEWRLAVDQVTGIAGIPTDPGVGFESDDHYGVGFTYGVDFVEGAYDDNLHISITPGEFHDYRLTSWDLRTYDFFIDGACVYNGWFLPNTGASRLAWGDDAQGYASLHRWDYVRVGTVPEPGTAVLALVFLVFLAHVRQDF